MEGFLCAWHCVKYFTYPIMTQAMSYRYPHLTEEEIELKKK